MKIPKLPPNTEEIINEIISEPEALNNYVKFSSGIPIRGKYLHWDKLRFYSPPKGLTHRQWWCAVKTARRNLYKQVTLKDKKGEAFNYLQVDPIGERLHNIDKGAAGIIQMHDQIVNPETRDHYIVSSLMKEAITSSQLEGAATTRKIAKEMIQTGRPPRDKSEQMILNNFVTMQQIIKVKDVPLSKKLIFKIHRLVTDKTLDEADAAGRFRKDGKKRIVGDNYGEVFHEPPAADQLEDRMKAMCKFANDSRSEDFIHPVIRSIILHFWLAYDHPFVDGNGRTARALFYWSMLRHGYWLFEFVSISQIILQAPIKYGRAFLYTETDDNDLTYFIIYHLEVVRRAIDDLHTYIDRKAKQLQKLEGQLRGIQTLNFRQRTLIIHALRHPKQRYTTNSHKISNNIVYETARTDMLNLRDRGLLDMIKVGRTQYFSAVSDLEEKLTKMP